MHRLSSLLLFSLLGIMPSVSRADRVDDYIRQELLRRHLPGLSVAVVKEGKIIKAKGYGLANVELSVPATDSTVYQIASITKLFTATAVIMLADEGKLDLDDKIAKHLKDLPPAWSEVTVRQLLDHTSGIPNFTDAASYTASRSLDRTSREVLNLVAATPLEFAPGAQFSYSNTGYILLGILIEQVAEMTYGDFLDGRIFKPLGMTNTRANDLRAVMPNRAQGYEWKGRELRNAEYTSPKTSFAAGMLVSTATDLAKWDIGLFSGKLLKRSRLEQMWTAKYPLGWDIQILNGHRGLVHAGDIAGFSSYFSHFEEDDLAIVVLLNGRGLHANAQKIGCGIAGRIAPALAKQQEKPIDDPDPQGTERLRRIVQGVFIDGVAAAAPFTAEMEKRNKPEILQSFKEANAMYGALLALQLLERSETDKGLQLRYRALFEGETAIVFVSLDREGKISGLGLGSD